ncbi:DUF4299 domain-containing protein [[Clostridium] innocuum]|nr:DUF4299 domain-containing protein [[Clostridium] innocuum]
MSVDVKIINKGIFKKKLQLQNFLDTGLVAGVMDDAWRMQPLENEHPDEFLLYDPHCIARGIQVVWKQYEVELYLLLPTCKQEIHAFYELIYHLCRLWKTSAFEQDGETQELRKLDMLQEQLCDFSRECLDNFLREHTEGCFFSAMHPLWFDAVDHEDMQKDFGAWLHTHQKQDFYYAAPRIYQSDHGLFGVYTITSGVDSLLPLQPEAPFGMKDPVSGRDIQVQEWYAAFYDLDEECFLGQLPYEIFVQEEQLANRMRYDAKMRLLPGMSAKRQRQLLEAFRVEL